MANKSNSKRIFRGRSMQGCLTCKNRHIKCDEGRPICQNCIKVNRECVQRDGSRALPLSISSHATAANAPKTTPARFLTADITVHHLRVVAENGNTSETVKTANTISNTISEPLSKYKEDKIRFTDHQHDVNNPIQIINKLDYPQTSIMNKKTVPKPKPAAPVLRSDKNVTKPATNSKPTNNDMSTTKETSESTPGAKFISPLSLASTTTNRPPSPNFTPLKPITHWVPPRPTIIARTELSEAEKAELCAEKTARKAEKEVAKQQKRKEIEMMVTRATEVQMQMRAQKLGGYRDCVFGTCSESAAACKCKATRFGGRRMRGFGANRER